MMRIERIAAVPVVVPTKRAVRTASGAITEAPLLLVDVAAKEGAVGRAYLFGFQAFMLRPLRDLVLAFGAMIEGDALAPRTLAEKLRARTTLFGARGLVGMALSAIDMAAWDAAARGANLPLARFLGGAPKPVPAYLGNGIGVVPAGEAAREAETLAELGFRAIKLRLGHPRLEDDLAARASDYIMLDAQMLGGVTGWRAGMAPAHAAGRQCSSHLFQEYSAHLLAVTPTAGWLEYFDIADPLLREPLALKGGMIEAPNRPGSGIDWDAKAVARYRLE